MVAAEWSAMQKLVAQIYARHDAEPFREAVDWKALGLFDYPQVIKKAMDLSQVKKNIENGKYSTINEAADDIRLIWDNCKRYNADGSDFYVLAQNFSKRFEDKFSKLVKEHGNAAKSSDLSSKGKLSAEPTLDEKKSFARSLYKISKEDLGKIICDLDEKCPTCLAKNQAEDEVEINVDLISPVVFHEVTNYVKAMIGDTPGTTSRKKKTTAAKPTQPKKARANP